MGKDRRSANIWESVRSPRASEKGNIYRDGEDCSGEEKLVEEPGYASKANVVKTCWKIISPNYDPAPETQAVFDALAEVRKNHGTAKPNGFHVEDKRFSFLYFERPLTKDEKNDINAFYDLVKRDLNPGS